MNRVAISLCLGLLLCWTGACRADAVGTTPPTAILQRLPKERPPRNVCAGALGAIVISYGVNTAGDVERVNIVRGSGCTAFDEEVSRLVKGWHFKPARKDGKVVSFEMTSVITPPSR